MLTLLGVVVVGIAPDHLFDEQASKIRIQSFSLMNYVKPAKIRRKSKTGVAEVVIWVRRPNLNI